MSNLLSPSTGHITLGIDVSKGRLDAHLHPLAVVKQFDNDRKGIAKLIAWITPLRPTRIIFEATGAYHRALEMALGKAALPAVKINPLQVRRFAQATGKRVKTDPIDAIMLARFGYTMQPDIPPARDETIDGLTELLAARRALVKDRTAALNRSKTLTLALLKRQSQQHRHQNSQRRRGQQRLSRAASFAAWRPDCRGSQPGDHDTPMLEPEFWSHDCEAVVVNRLVGRGGPG